MDDPYSMDEYNLDAWKQIADLKEKYTAKTEVRRDIDVIAHAWDRGVEVILWEFTDDNTAKKWHKSTGKRNVRTMRELARAINDACDFVEASNPKWASHPPVEEMGLTMIILEGKPATE